ncbi:hypothetical protein BGLA2_1270010 [Burkholderia gladioli]|nr:hypothetical protein BGLA2_1270010 [Burkholderia gladioli]
MPRDAARPPRWVRRRKAAPDAELHRAVGFTQHTGAPAAGRK